MRYRSHFDVLDISFVAPWLGSDVCKEGAKKSKGKTRTSTTFN